jgi:hypothetical protein
MMAGPVLWLGLVLGLRHALEADHVAAVASLSARASSWRDILRVAASWGLGHALVILAAGTALAALGLVPPAWLRDRLEGLAGLILVALGLDVLRRLRAIRSVARDQQGLAALARGAARRALVVGGVHGLAGSAALLVAVVPAVGSRGAMVVYLALFGLGTILGMGICSLALFLPLQLGARRLPGLDGVLRLTIGASSVALGAWLVLRPLG